MKTSEEIKRGLKLCSHEGHGEEIICGHCPYDSNSCAVLICTRRLSADALAYIQQLETENHQLLKDRSPRWISVEERLPEDTGKYIVCTTKGSVYCTRFIVHSWRRDFQTDINTHITHWMPMPEPPKEDDHEDNLHG